MRPTNFLAPESGVHLPKLPEQSREPQPNHAPKRRSRRRRFVRWLFVFAFLAFLGVGVFLGIGGARLAKDALALKAAGESAKAALDAGDVEGAHAALGDVVTAAYAVRGDLDYFRFVR